jgi:hypothetical protein
MKVKFLLVFLLGLNGMLHAQQFFKDKGIVIYKLKKVIDTEVFAMSESSILIKGHAYNLGEGTILKSSIVLDLDSSFYNDIVSKMNNSNSMNTSFFADSMHSDVSSKKQINYGGNIFVPKNNGQQIDSFYIAFSIKAKYVLLDLPLVKNIPLKRLHCYESNNTLVYPIITPLHIKRYQRLKRCDIRKMGLKKINLEKYYFQDCD